MKRVKLQNWQHLLIISLAIGIISGGLVFIFLHFDLIPNPFSVERGYIDDFVKILFSIASIIFAIVCVFLGYSLIFFRRRQGDQADGPAMKGNSQLERAWTIIPLAIVIALSVYGAIALDRMTAAGPPQTELEIDVSAFRYGWQFSYPEYNLSSFELHAPVNQRIVLKLQSKDVVHSFWVQEWGPKQDVVPGITTQVRYTPTRIGQYMVRCSQLCGPGHTYMTAPVFVTSTADFQGWVQQQGQAKPAPTPAPSKTPPPGAAPSSAPSSTPSPAASATPTFATPPATSAAINLTAKNIAFNLSSIMVPAGADVSLNFDNQDSGIPHNFSVYIDNSAAKSIFVGQIITGPSTTTYKFKAPAVPGNYFFRCDVHPTTMTGTLVVK